MGATYSGWLRGWRKLPWCDLLTTPGSRACWPRLSGRWRPAGSPVEEWVYLQGCQWELLTLCRKRPWNANQSHSQKYSTGQQGGDTGNTTEKVKPVSAQLFQHGVSRTLSGGVFEVLLQWIKYSAAHDTSVSGGFFFYPSLCIYNLQISPYSS